MKRFIPINAPGNFRQPSAYVSSARSARIVGPSDSGIVGPSDFRGLGQDPQDMMPVSDSMLSFGSGLSKATTVFTVLVGLGLVAGVVYAYTID